MSGAPSASSGGASSRRRYDVGGEEADYGDGGGGGGGDGNSDASDEPPADLPDGASDGGGSFGGGGDGDDDDDDDGAASLLPRTLRASQRAPSPSPPSPRVVAAVAGRQRRRDKFQPGIRFQRRHACMSSTMLGGQWWGGNAIVRLACMHGGAARRHRASLNRGVGPLTLNYNAINCDACIA